MSGQEREWQPRAPRTPIHTWCQFCHATVTSHLIATENLLPCVTVSYVTSHKWVHSVTETQVLFTLFHLTLGTQNSNIQSCHHASESQVTHSHKDSQSQLHILSHSLTVLHVLANMALHSHKDTSHTVVNLQFHT